MVARARRRWPLLALAPAAWIARSPSPTAAVVRREVSRTAIRALVPLGVLVVALMLLGGP